MGLEFRRSPAAPTWGEFVRDQAIPKTKPTHRRGAEEPRFRLAHNGAGRSGPLGTLHPPMDPGGHTGLRHIAHDAPEHPHPATRPSGFQSRMPIRVADLEPPPQVRVNGALFGCTSSQGLPRIITGAGRKGTNLAALSPNRLGAVTGDRTAPCPPSTSHGRRRRPNTGHGWTTFTRFPGETSQAASPEQRFWSNRSLSANHVVRSPRSLNPAATNGDPAFRLRHGGIPRNLDAAQEPTLWKDHRSRPRPVN